MSFRAGSEKDLNFVKDFCKTYRTNSLDICENYSLLRLEDKMKKISIKDFTRYSSLLVIIMSHGDIDDHIHAYDGLFDLEPDIVDPIVKNCTLKEKPILFFIQACRGNDIMDSDAARIVQKNKANIIKCYSTYEGTISFRDSERGTYFIQILLSLIKEHEDKDLTEIMDLIRRCFYRAK
ncbi:hypothetical protein pipiens_000474, partial [Culex pipiens pipiens]